MSSQDICSKFIYFSFIDSSCFLYVGLDVMWFVFLCLFVFGFCFCFFLCLFLGRKAHENEGDALLQFTAGFLQGRVRTLTIYLMFF